MNSVLVVAAHADDEVIGCGGTLAKHKANNDNISIIYMTDGVSARPNAEVDAVTSRNKMAHEAGSYLNAQQYFFSHPDNKMDEVPLIDIIQPLESLIAKISPDIIYTHHYGDLNIDHQIVHQAVLTANRPQPGTKAPRIYSFEVNSSTEWGVNNSALSFSPNSFVDISEYIDDKKELLDIYQEEMRSYPHTRSIKAITALASVRGTSVGVDYAEAFMLVREVK